MGYVIGVFFILGGLNQMGRDGFWGFLGGLLILGLGVLFCLGQQGASRINRRKEIDARVDKALRERDLK